MPECSATMVHNSYPLLILLEREDQSVLGVVMNNPRHALLANEMRENCERHEVEAFIAELRVLDTGASFGLCQKDSDVQSASLMEAIDSTPVSASGQKSILIYRGDEWQSCLWNSGGASGDEELDLRSVADFYGGRVSAGHRARRPSLDVARGSQTLPGDYSVLAEALLAPSGDYASPEEHAGLKVLCGWWNAQAPDAMRTAAVGRVYWWREDERSFVAGDPEEPAMLADQLAEQPSYTLFEQDGFPVVAVVFYQGRRFNTTDGGGATQIHFADGSVAYSVGMEAETVDEAAYSVEGLGRLHSSLPLNMLYQLARRFGRPEEGIDVCSR